MYKNADLVFKKGEKVCYIENNRMIFFNKKCTCRDHEINVENLLAIKKSMDEYYFGDLIDVFNILSYVNNKDELYTKLVCNKISNPIYPSNPMFLILSFSSEDLFFKDNTNGIYIGMKQLLTILSFEQIKRYIYDLGFVISLINNICKLKVDNIKVIVGKNLNGEIKFFITDMQYFYHSENIFDKFVFIKNELAEDYIKGYNFFLESYNSK